MDYGFSLKNENPCKKANILSKITFLWFVDMIAKAKTIKIKDMYKNLKCNSSEINTEKLERNWIYELSSSKTKCRPPSLLRAILKSFTIPYLKFTSYHFILYTVFKPYQPIVMGQLIMYFQKGRESKVLDMCITTTIMICIGVVIAVLNQQSNYGIFTVGMRARVAMSSLIYKKALRLDQNCLTQNGNKMLNMLSNDVNRFDQVSCQLDNFLITPFQVCIAAYFMWRTVGLSAFAGLILLVFIIFPIQVYLGRMSSKFRLEIAQITDRRVKIMNEIISGMKVIKMYAWEKPFKRIIDACRNEEIGFLHKASILRCYFLNGQSFLDKIALFTTVWCYVLLGNEVSGDKVFVLLQFYYSLIILLAVHDSMVIYQGCELLVSIRRFQEFLMLTEKTDLESDYNFREDIQLQNVSAFWVEPVPTLQNISATIPKGSLCAIIGPVGAGKSSLIQLLLGEMPTVDGNIRITQNVAYASQDPWLFCSSVRNNILFGQPYKKEKYNEVVKVCALVHDINSFPDGDQTLIGERGITLSGGQKARINLARAIYRDADVYLLDDPLSAVDAVVGNHLFNECIIKYLAAKTRILVTHQLQFVKKVDLILALNKGEIEAFGTYKMLRHAKSESISFFFSKSKDNYDNNIEPNYRTKNMDTTDINSNFEKRGFVTEESSKNIRPFREYIKNINSKVTFFWFLVIFLVTQLAFTSCDFWITFWVKEDSLRHTVTNLTITSESYIFDDLAIDGISHSVMKTRFILYVYMFLTLTVFLVSMLRPSIFSKATVRASKNLHDRMINGILNAPIKFFHDNHSGRIVNRFFKDLGAIDEVLPYHLFLTVQISLLYIASSFLIVFSNVYMIVFIIALTIIIWKLKEVYIQSAICIKHLEGIAKSPVFEHINSSLQGIATIRTTKSEDILIKQFHEHQDVHSSAWYLTIIVGVSFGLWIDIMCIFFVACVCFTLIFLSRHYELDAAFMGLAISQALSLTGLVQFGIRQASELVNQLASVERVLQYINLDKEDEHMEILKISSFDTNESSWPTQGRIQFINVFLKYSQYEPNVLHNINLTVNSKEKIGIVGRTGSGKSSLIAALFRLAKIEGKILIDGVDTATMDLATLRKNISIIPQEPVLFSETIRYNLDPFNDYKDDDLWNALDEVELKSNIPSLDFMITEGGNNFSLGQRQLICLARAILRNNRILVLDEATANVDFKTDALIQSTIRRKFLHCTVLTIAHRLSTIMDSDKVLLIDGGNILEFDSPHLLLQEPSGYFKRIVEETGLTMFENVKQKPRTD